MPNRPPRFDRRNGRPAPERKPWATTTTPRRERGYGPEWDVLRAQVLREEPTCRLCRENRRIVPSTTVDHIVPKARGGTNDRPNLQALCLPCHKSKTAREDAHAR